MQKRGLFHFISGFVAGALLFGGAVAAAAAVQEQITVYFRPLRYVIDGAEKSPRAGQQGFIYDGRVYVPLRFVAEALGRPVDWDDATSTVYVGAIPGDLPEVWQDLTQQGEGVVSVRYFTEGALSLQGVDMPESALISLAALGQATEEKRGITGQVWADYDVPEGVTRMTGTLFVPRHYAGAEGERRVGRMVVLNELNRAIYQSSNLTTASAPERFDVPLQGVRRVRIAVTLHPYEGMPLGDSLTMAQIGISQLEFK